MSSTKIGSNIYLAWAVVVAQLAKRSLPRPEGKKKINEKEPGNGPFKTNHYTIDLL